ncbi:hypothetical protein A2721_01590 [Candidatus Gottesmanbacteria bacterium RIFCSPHIGHO2_01_FULL_47_48]|uniref:Toxin n=1 Tax=Candidatus Gottesmanbacteria bacterium RIFCSPHIGHO2_01_FULL_47_48 TaxID=1798381 RepID=A0A1F6A1A4_9BACT|nr:MAG: hypothetical protein A2721_01590 [Candidatus Gottesmanbacteria bacterium RIFCSPHIGHO2_01_FULL_47_48]
MTIKANFEYNEDKNQFLKSLRGVSFEDVVDAAEKGDILDNIEHPNKIKYPNQRILVVKIRDYVYAVPYVLTKDGRAFLKTMYANRELNSIYLKYAKDAKK